MKKRIIILIIIIASLFSLVLILNHNDTETAPEITANKFIQGVSEADLETIKSTMKDSLYTSLQSELENNITKSLNAKDVDFKSIDGFNQSYENVKTLLQSVSAEIIDVNYNDNKSSVKIDLQITHADGSILIDNTLSSLFAKLIEKSFGSDEPTDVETTKMLIDSFNESFKEYKLVTKTDVAFVKLIKVDGEWVISELDENLVNYLLFGGVDSLESIGLKQDENIGKFEKTITLSVNGSKGLSTININTYATTLEEVLIEYYKGTDIVIEKTENGNLIKTIKGDSSDGNYNWYISSEEACQGECENYIDKIEILKDSSFLIEFIAKKES